MRVLGELSHHATSTNGTIIDGVHGIIGTQLVKPDHLLVCNNMVDAAA